jgi:hypothetical protein
VIHSRANIPLPDSIMVYDLVKIMRVHTLFSKVSTSELIPVASHAKIETSDSNWMINQNDNIPPALILDNTIELKYGSGFDMNLKEKDFIGPYSFTSDKIISINIPASTSYYSFNSGDLQDLISGSDVLLGTLLADQIS